ncbi:MAG: bifunctional 4-hydroxy-2-oxoglutarate aldolase/2-dehydro-3-deoxy-phosphogluconate aldolase [Bacteroidetes bacterium]|nr:bifunctional 4-hydroxy-2-oxoglutarate aldolase/2-dehydro-3-deoxy-phosphogluconate aldolase [Bacteroidota bacterium]
MRASKSDILSAIEKTGLVPLFYHDDVSTATHVIEASYRGGARVFEFANRGPNALTVFRELVNRFSSYADFYLGIGTIMNAPQAKEFIDAGAQFLVSPIFKTEIAEVVTHEDIIWIPGTGTMTEIVTAVDAGTALVKVFPGAVLGPVFVSSVLPILPALKIMPTGGVEPNEQNLSAWFKAGVFCVGMGSQLFPAIYVASNNWIAIENQVRETLQIIGKVRPK